tara:strand:+ start:881 stop:1237 length:357 start_codon:yes stop_codon:yes gene_type:complete
MVVYKEYYINSARYLPNLKEGHICSKFHGHTYNIKVFVEGSVNKETGFVIDAFDIDKQFKKIHKQLDHKVLNDISGLENPTSENICIWIWQKLSKNLPLLSKIEIMENSVTGFVYKGD